MHNCSFVFFWVIIHNLQQKNLLTLDDHKWTKLKFSKRNIFGTSKKRFEIKTVANLPYKINWKEQEVVNNFCETEDQSFAVLLELFIHILLMLIWSKLFQLIQGLKGNFIRNKMALILSNLVAVEWRYDIFLQSEVELFLLIFAVFVYNLAWHLFGHLLIWLRFNFMIISDSI